MIDPQGNRLPCERCGSTLYYSEREQRFCRGCATDLGLDRICDRMPRSMLELALLARRPPRAAPPRR